MLQAKYAIVNGLLVAAVIAFAGLAQAQERGAPGRTEVGGTFKSADATTITISVTTAEAGRRDGAREERVAPTATDKTYNLAKNIEVVVRAGNGRPEAGLGRGGVGGGLFKEAKLTDFAPGIRVSLTLSADQKSVESVLAEGTTILGLIKAVDADKQTVTIQLPAQGARERGGDAPAAEEKTYTLAPDAEISIDDGRGNRFSIKEAKAIDLSQGAHVSARLSANLKQIQAIHAEGPTFTGTVKAIDPAKKTLSISAGAQGRGGDAAEEQRLTVSTDAVIVLDTGKGRRLSVKTGKLADVPVGATVTVRLAVDQSFVMFLRAEGGTISGHLKSIDAEKRVIVLAIGGGRGEDAQEKALTLAKDARILLDGKEVPLTDLKTGDDSPIVQVRLALESGQVQALIANAARGR